MRNVNWISVLKSWSETRFEKGRWDLLGVQTAKQRARSRAYIRRGTNKLLDTDWYSFVPTNSRIRGCGVVLMNGRIKAMTPHVALLERIRQCQSYGPVFTEHNRFGDFKRKVWNAGIDWISVFKHIMAHVSKTVLTKTTSENSVQWLMQSFLIYP